MPGPISRTTILCGDRKKLFHHGKTLGCSVWLAHRISFFQPQPLLNIFGPPRAWSVLEVLQNHVHLRVRLLLSSKSSEKCELFRFVDAKGSRRWWLCWCWHGLAERIRGWSTCASSECYKLCAVLKPFLPGTKRLCVLRGNWGPGLKSTNQQGGLQRTTFPPPSSHLSASRLSAFFSSKKRFGRSATSDSGMATTCSHKVWPTSTRRSPYTQRGSHASHTHFWTVPAQCFLTQTRNSCGKVCKTLVSASLQLLGFANFVSFISHILRLWDALLILLAIMSSIQWKFWCIWDCIPRECAGIRPCDRHSLGIHSPHSPWESQLHMWYVTTQCFILFYCADLGGNKCNHKP